VKLLAVISLATLAAVLVLVLRPAGLEKPAPRPAGFHTEPVPAEPLVEIFPVGEVERPDLELVASALAKAFKVRIRLAGGMALPDAAWNEARKQHHADWILRAAGALRNEGAFRTILVTEADIYLGDLPHIISLISPDRKKMLISTARLGGAGRVELPIEQVQSRIRRLAIRLLAASLGISGCNGDCVLAGRLTAENLDKVPDYFCPQCATLLERTLETGIGSPYSYLMDAQFRSKMGEIDKAIEDLKKAIELKHDYLAAYLNLAGLYDAKGWHAEAITTLRRATKAIPRSIEPRKKLAWVLLRNNQPSAALEELQVALTLEPESREVHRMLGIVYQLYLCDAVRAAFHYRRFLELGGDPALIEDLLDFPEEEPGAEDGE
jgi:predicted Zn-dependent protease